MGKFTKSNLSEDLQQIIERVENDAISEDELKTFLLNNGFDEELNENSSYTDFIKKIAEKSISNNPSGGVPYGRVFYDSPTTTVFTVPEGVHVIYVSGASGGGGGGGGYGDTVLYYLGGGGGSSLCAVRLPIFVTPGEELTITVGKGGVGGAKGSYGGTPRYTGKEGDNGGVTSIGNRVTLTGGKGGKGASENYGSGDGGDRGSLTYTPTGSDPTWNIPSVESIFTITSKLIGVIDGTKGTKGGGGGRLQINQLGDAFAVITNLRVSTMYWNLHNLGRGGDGGSPTNNGLDGDKGFVFLEWGDY